MNLKEFIYFKAMPFVNRLLNPFSIKIVTLRTPNRNFGEFFKHLQSLNYDVASVIDVGVGKGTDSLYKGWPKAKFYLVEAVPDINDVVRNIAKKLNAKFFNVAAGNKKGTVEFYLHADITGSSLLKQTEHNADINGVKTEVQMERLDSLIKDEIEYPCLLKIDTQGTEIDVIEGAKEILDRIDMMILEVSFHEFREGAPEMSQVISYMESIGYVPYETLEGHYRSIDNALAQIDIVFVKKDSVLRKEKAFFSDAQVELYLKDNKL